MSNDDAGGPQRAGPKPKSEAVDERRQRLADALRQNLARRKAQGRARKSAGDGESDPSPADER